jgi:hypothetical protein
MDKGTTSRQAWLARLRTTELVIYLLELQPTCEDQPELSTEVANACRALRAELARREWPVATAP